MDPSLPLTSRRGSLTVQPEHDAILLETGISGFLWGVLTLMSIQALYILFQKGLKGSSGRGALFALVVFLYLSSSSIYAGLFWEMLVYKSSDALIGYPVVVLNVSMSWICRFNYFACDVILVWRAWVLWPKHRPIKTLLASCLCVSLGASMADGVLISIKLLHTRAEEVVFMPHGGLLLYIPLLITNIASTGCIGYKAWLHRKSLKILGDSTTSDCATSIEQILALLVESGLFYCLLWLFFTLIQFNAIHGNSSTQTAGVWSSAMHGACGIYPTIIVIIVALQRTQQDILMPARYANAGPLDTMRFRPRGEGGETMNTEGV